MTDFSLSGEERAALEDIGLTAMGSGAMTLSILLNQQVTITSPSAQVVDNQKMLQILQEPSVLVELPLIVGTNVPTAFFFSQADTARITDLMMGGEGSPPDSVMDELRLSAISEAVNQMMGMAANALTSTYGRKVEISPPKATVIDQPEELVLPPSFEGGPFVIVTYLFSIEGLVESQIFQIYSGTGARDFTQALRRAEARPAPSSPRSPSPEEIMAASGGTAPGATSEMAQGRPDPQAYMAMPSGAPPSLAGAPTAWPGTVPPQAWPGVPQGASMREQPVAQPVTFGPLMGSVPMMHQQVTGLDLIMDVPLKVTVELGRTRMQIRDVLELGKGSVVELDKLAGEPVDLLVNGKLIARGEVVVIDENFGIRVTDIVSPLDRVTGFRGIGP